MNSSQILINNKHPEECSLPEVTFGQINTFGNYKLLDGTTGSFLETTGQVISIVMQFICQVLYAEFFFIMSFDVGEYFCNNRAKEAKIVRQIFKWYTEEGHGSAKIVAGLFVERFANIKILTCGGFVPDTMGEEQIVVQM